MTAIVGFTDGKRTWIGGDSAASSENYIETRSEPKVFKKGEMIFGYTNSFRFGQILEYHLRMPSRKQNTKKDIEYIIKDLIPAIKKVVQNHSEEEFPDGDFLIGYRGNLYVIERDFQVGKINKDFHAAGCANEIALGCFMGLKDNKMTPEKRLNKVLNACYEFSSYVRPPFHIIST